MKKRAFCFFFAVLTLFTVFSASAELYTYETVCDMADVLSSSSELRLRQNATSLAHEENVEFLILTTTNTGAKPIDRYAEDYYDSIHVVHDSALLLVIDVANREYYLYAVGEAYWEGYLIEVEKAFLPYLRNSDYEGACEAYQATAISLYSYRHSLSVPPSDYELADLAVPLMIVLVVALLIAWGVTAAMKRKMKTARPKRTAHDYVREDSFALREKSDLYLYCTRTRVRVNNNSSSGDSRSGGGGSRGGRGGSF